MTNTNVSTHWFLLKSPDTQKLTQSSIMFAAGVYRGRTNAQFSSTYVLKLKICSVFPCLYLKVTSSDIQTYTFTQPDACFRSKSVSIHSRHHLKTANLTGSNLSSNENNTSFISPASSSMYLKLFSFLQYRGNVFNTK